MYLEWLREEFTVGKWTTEREQEELGQYSFWSRTDCELSLLCPSEKMPVDVERKEEGWKGFRVSGQLDFALIGILARIADALAKAEISIFAVSTFDTDYIFLKKEKASLAQKTLEAAGWHFI